MYICYIDESGTPEVPGTSSHYILAGLSIPINHWKACDSEIALILRKYGLEDAEIHTAWMVRKYIEQDRISNFDKLSWDDRRHQVRSMRNKYLLGIQGNKKLSKTYRQSKKNFRKSDAYAHLSFDERLRLINEIASKISSWGNARLFAECVDKLHFDPSRNRGSIDEIAFEQVISRFQQYLSIAVANGIENGIPLGIIVHDNNQSVAKKHTDLMRQFHKNGTLWTKVENIIETPMFVDSGLTRMVQLADLCSYAIRRYLENGEVELFQKIFDRADRNKGKTVGVRHFAGSKCTCAICASH